MAFEVSRCRVCGTRGAFGELAAVSNQHEMTTGAIPSGRIGCSGALDRTLEKSSDIRPYHHLAILGLSTLVLAGACILHVDGDTVVFGDSALPSVCWLRHTPLEGCPGCGLTRSVVAFCHFQWRSSVALHPAGWLVVVLALVQFPYRLPRLLVGKEGLDRPWAVFIGRFALLLVLVLGAVNWFARMIVP